MTEKLAGTAESWTDYAYWKNHDAKIAARIDRLVGDILEDPYAGIGDPQALKEDLDGFWSRRIDGTHRLVYAMDENKLTIISCRYHYE
jgi:toxin YoeB